MYQLTNINKLSDDVLTELWRDFSVLSVLSLTDIFSLCYHWERRLWNLIDSYDQKVPLSLCYCMWGGRCGRCAGLILAASSCTDRPARRAVFVFGCSQRQFAGLRQDLWPNPALLFSQGLSSSCDSSGLSTVCCLLRRYRSWRPCSFSCLFFFFFFKCIDSSSFLTVFLMSSTLSYYSAWILSFFIARSFEWWGGKEGRSKNAHTLCPPISLGYLWWHY